MDSINIEASEIYINSLIKCKTFYLHTHLKTYFQKKKLSLTNYSLVFKGIIEVKKMYTVNHYYMPKCQRPKFCLKGNSSTSS